MDEHQIARSMAQLLNRQEEYSLEITTVSNDGSCEEEALDYVQLKNMTVKLAKSRAEAKGGDFWTVLDETELEVSKQLARILATTVDPILESLQVVEGDGSVCGVCLEDMEFGDEAIRAMSCQHRFHGYCIFKWLKQNNVCPLCRYQNRI